MPDGNDFSILLSSKVTFSEENSETTKWKKKERKRIEYGIFLLVYCFPFSQHFLVSFSVEFQVFMAYNTQYIYIRSVQQ